MTEPQNIVDLAFELSRLMRSAMSQSDPKHASTLLRLQGLVLIRETPEITMKDLAKKLSISASTATVFVDRVVEFGWVERKADKTNRRLVRLHLTPRGKKCLTKYLQERRTILRRSIAQIPTKDQRELQRILLKLVTNFRNSSHIAS